MIVALLGLAAILLAIISAQRLKSSTRTALPPLPPGPKPLPIVGNMLGMNKNAPYLTYTQWSKTYGDIVYTRVLGRDIIILNSVEVATALLEKRSQKYSDRPPIAHAELFGWQWTTSAASYGSRFRLHRRLLHQVFHAQAALAYRPKQLQKAYEMMTRLLDDPPRYADHFATFSAAVAMQVTYGYNVQGGESFVKSMQKAIDIFLSVATPELAALYSAFPFVKVLPAWLPGMGFKYKAFECQHLLTEAVSAPYAWVRQRIAEGHATPCMVSDAIVRHRLDDYSNDSELAQGIKDSSGTLYSASVETTNSTLIMFVYLMMNHPEIQRLAQAEVDDVVGRHRLPDFEDRPSLPYVDAVLRETMRWHPVAPIGVPHATTEDDVYRGYHIPQGAMIVANVWAMSHNEDKYSNPDAFIPERFLNKDGSLNGDNIPWVFGFGRRICPGRHVADASLWCTIVCILSLFTIEKTEGSDDVKWTTGFGSHPLPFPCKFLSRDKEMDAQKLASLIYASRVDL